MKSCVSFTQAFYDLLDLSEIEQKRVLASLRQEDPDLYKKLADSIGNQSSFNLSEVIGFHAEQSTLQQDSPDLTGQTVGKYQLIKELGRGGMGSVYEATRADQTFEQKLAIKLIHPSLDKIISNEFLYLEAQVLARLNHPHIAKVYDGGRHDSLIYIAMEKVEGDNLRSFIDRGLLTRTASLELFIKIASAISHAHQNQILHADIKPENVLIDSSGDPKVIDFNITQKVEKSTLSLDSSLLAFSEKFASPEQKKGSYLTNQSDVYSLGKLLDAMLADFQPESDEVYIINKATEPEVTERYASVDAMIQDVENILNQRPISLKSHQPVYVFQKLLKRKPFHIAASALLSVSAITFSAVLVSKNHQLNTEKAIAEEMMFEMTQLMFHSKGDVDKEHSVQNMLELTRRRVLSNPDLPRELKQKMLLAMMTPVPERASNSEYKKSRD